MIVSEAMGSGRLRLFCLPHAGGSSARFVPWARWLSGQAEVIAVDMPGHGRRMREPLVTAWRPLADDMAAIIGAQADGAYAVFGHSLGALVAFEACRTLAGRGHPPALLVVAGRNGPSAGLPHRPIHDLPDAEFVSALQRLGGTQDAALSDPELLEMFLPVLRNDMRLVEVYERVPGPPLPCPIAVFAGRHDTLTDDFGLLAWKRETTRSFELHLIDGHHFFLDEPEFTEALAARLAGTLRDLFKTSKDDHHASKLADG